MLSPDLIREAAVRIAPHVRRTPVHAAERGVVLKLEQVQHSGSFKARGAFNRLLAAREEGALGPAGVVCATGGNHGLAVAFAGARLDVPVEVFLPVTADAGTVARLRALGASVHRRGAEFGEASAAALARQGETGALLCHPYDDPEVCAGHGTVGLELLEQAPDVDTLLVAVGGGGLLAGVVTALSGRTRVVAVEPEAAPSLHRALAAGRPVDVPAGGVAADALGAPRVGGLAFAAARAADVRSVLVPEAAVREARAGLWEEHRLAVEPAGAVAYAALACGAYSPAAGERVAVLLCGANGGFGGFGGFGGLLGGG